MKITKFFLAIGLLLLFFACEKDIINHSSASRIKKATVDTLSYEIYDSAGVYDYQDLRSELIDIFDGTSSYESVPVNKFTWLFEGGLSALFLDDSLYNNGDSTVEFSRVVTFTLSDDEIDNDDFVTEFTTEFEDIENYLNNNSTWTYSLTDVQFYALGVNNQIKLRFHTSFLVNATKSYVTPPTVPSASIHRYGGAAAICGAINGNGAWWFIERQIRSVMPKKLGAYVNLKAFNSDGSRFTESYIDGTFLFGQANALHYPSPALQLDCIYDYMQDDFAQEIVDQIYDLISKRYYWEGAVNLHVDKFNYSNNALWYHRFSLGNYMTPYGPSLTAPDLGL